MTRARPGTKPAPPPASPASRAPRSWRTLESFCAAALVPVDTEVLVRATGLQAGQLRGQELTVAADQRATA